MRAANPGHGGPEVSNVLPDDIEDAPGEVPDGAEVCELVGMYLLHLMGQKYDKQNIGLYRDDGLAAFKAQSGPQNERNKKAIQKKTLLCVFHKDAKDAQKK